MIKEGGASNTCSARTIWTVHSQYKGTVKSKYVDIAISLAWPSVNNYTSQQGDKGGLQGPRLEGFTSNSLHTGSYCF